MNTGLILSNKDIRDYKLDKNISLDLPEEFQLEKVPIKNQKQFPTCTAHALASLVEYHTKKESNNYFRYSTNFIYGNRDNNLYNGEGLSLRDGLNILYNLGDILYDYCPGNSYYIDAKEKVEHLSKDLVINTSNISAYYKILSLEQLKYSIYNDGPVIVSIKLFDNYKLKNNVYTYNCNDTYIYHAVLAVGWTKSSLILQNSWGPYWGNKGYFYININDIKICIKEMYGVTDNIETILIKPYNNMNYLPKIINLLILIYKNICKKLCTFTT